MKIIVKNIKGQKFEIEVENTTKLSELKEKIATEMQVPIETQKLILAGKQLEDDKVMDDYGIKEGTPIVCFQTKKTTAAAKPTEEAKPANPAPFVNIQPTAAAATEQPPATTVQAQPVAQPEPVAQPQPAAQPQPVAAPVQPPASTAVSPEMEEAVQNLVIMTGQQRDTVVKALQIARGNPDLAFEVLQHTPEEIARLEQQQRAGGGASGGGAGANQGLEALQALVQSPNFAQIRQRILQNPAFMQEFLMQLAQSNPALAQFIQQNPQAFLQFILQGGMPGMGGGMPQPAAQDPGFQGAGGMGGGAMPGMPQPGQIQVTPEEKEAIDRLSSLGFSKAQAAQAYFACDKNEEYAANFLFESMQDDQEFMTNAAIQQSMAQQQPAASQQPASQQPASQQPAQPDPVQQEPAQPDEAPKEEDKPASNSDQPAESNNNPGNKDDEDGSAFD